MARSMPFSPSAAQMLIAVGVGLPILLVAIVAFGWQHMIAVTALAPREDVPAAQPLAPYAFRVSRSERVSRSDQKNLETNICHETLKVISDVPPVRQPATWCTDQLRLPNETDVIGVLVGDEAYAFVINAMRSPASSIVSLTISGTPIVVTYCDPTDQARVFTEADQENLIPLRLGGMDVNHRMVLMLDGMRYPQMSRSLPLNDYPFEIASLTEWSHRYPRSRLYLGPCYPPADLMNQLRSSLP